MENEKKVLELTNAEFECIKHILTFERDELKAHIDNANKILKIQKSRADNNTSNINGFALSIFNRDIKVINNILYKMIECKLKRSKRK